MRIITYANCEDWTKLLKVAQTEGVQSIVRKNQYGREFFTLYGNTFPIKDKLSQLGFKFFKGTWGKPVDSIDDKIKNGLVGLGVDISPLSITPDVNVPQEVAPGQAQQVQEVAPQAEKTMVEKELERMKDGVDMAMKESGSERMKGLLSFVDRMIERVAQMTDETAQSDFIKNFLAFAARFHDYSFHNQMLIWVQKPSAQYVKGFKQWIELGREVVNWDNGITIIAPMYKKIEHAPEDFAGKSQDEVNAMNEQRRVYFGAVSVYDVSDTRIIPNWEKTKGKPAFEPPKLKTNPNEDIEEVTVLVNACMDWAKEKNIDVSSEKMGEEMGGYSAGGKIRLNDAYRGVNMFSTMVHESAHEILHWVEKEGAKGEKMRPDKQESRQSKEIDAEATAYIVLKHYGFETVDAPKYLALWKAKGEDIKARRDNIRKAVSIIIDGIDSKIKANTAVEAKNKMKIKISKTTWEDAGKKAGWYKTAQDLSLVKSVSDLTDRELTRAIRDAIIAEEGAIKQYENVVDSTSNEKAKAVLTSVANEEKVHVGELQKLLTILLKDEQGFLDDGAKEVDKSKQ